MKPKNQEVFKDLRILVAEDDVTYQAIVEGFLKRLGCEFDLVNNGEKATQQVDKRDYHICLMDLVMPVMSGVEATEIIRQKHGDRIPIVGITSMANQTARDLAIQAGMNACLPKPTMMKRLREIILQWARTDS